LPRLYFQLEARRLRAECGRVFPTCRAHLVTSELDRSRLAALAPGASMAIVPNGVDTSAFPSVYRTGPRDGFTMIFIGGATWYPNRHAIDWLLDEIWPLCKQRIPGARLVCLGRSPSSRSIEAARRDDRLVVAGYVEDIVPWAAGADVFVCPMRDGGGTRLKILTAMSLGLPIVSTAIGMEGIEAESPGHYLDAEDTEAFVRRLAQLASSPAEGQRLSTEGRSLAVARYDWKIAGAVVRSCIEAVVSR
jgi:glycosyltransferase involved in cell wall biosynthesis